MGNYTITTGQNLYDIAMHIHGSIEGIVDLMINNSELSLDDKLQAGAQLIYTASNTFITKALIILRYWS